MTTLSIPLDVLAAIDRGAALVLSMSGGKDSQAMATAVVDWVRSTGRTNPIHAVHADLGRAEWTETTSVVRAQAQALGLELDIVQRHVRGQEPQDLLDVIQARAVKVGESTPFWPSATSRYCTSDLKRDPINKYLRRLGYPLVISVEGIRADESRARSCKPCWEPRKAISTATREALTWRPVHEWSEADVWELLGGREGELVHPAYALGNDRLSCSLCIFGSAGDLERGALHQPEYANELADLEEAYGFTFTETTSILELCRRLGIRDGQEATIPSSESEPQEAAGASPTDEAQEAQGAQAGEAPAAAEGPVVDVAELAPDTDAEPETAFEQGFEGDGFEDEDEADLPSRSWWESEHTYLMRLGLSAPVLDAPRAPEEVA